MKATGAKAHSHPLLIVPDKNKQCYGLTPLSICPEAVFDIIPLLSGLECELRSSLLNYGTSSKQ
jgi:hypothetical protein